MLDLDSLAERRAKALNQKEDTWREAVWSPDFQTVSQSMTDGEVEAMISLCSTVELLRALVLYLNSHSAASGMAPYTVLTSEAARAGLNPGEWIQRNLGDR